MKKSEYYKDIIQYIEARLDLIDALSCACVEKEHSKKEKYLYIVEQRQQEINKWMNEEVNDSL